VNKAKPGKGSDFYLGNVTRVKKLLGLVFADFFFGFGQLNLIGDVEFVF
jgi:hypothetical protein